MPSRHELAAESLSGHGFRLISGDYALSFDKGTIRVSRCDRRDGLTFATLGRGGLDALDNVRQRRIASVDAQPIVTLVAEHEWAELALSFDGDPTRPGLFHWQFAVTPHAAPPGHHSLPEIAFTTEPDVTLYTQQAPMAAGLVYLYEGAILDSTVFYYQDLTALNGYFAASHTAPMGDAFPTPLQRLPSGIVGLKDRFLGLVLPGARLAALPIGATTVVSEGYVALTTGQPTDEPAVAQRFLQDLAAVYRRIKRPETELVDWRGLAQRTAHDLLDPRNWVEVGDQSFLRSYVNDDRTTPELIAQLDVLTSLRDYQSRYGSDVTTSSLAERLSGSLSYFYSAEAGAVVNWPPSSRWACDSWYFVTALVDLARLAEGGDATAYRLLMDSVEQVMEVAHRYDYVFPIHFDIIGERHPPAPRLHPPNEYDVAGAYAYLMLDLYKWSSEAQYLAEAQGAVEALRGHGFDLAYELHVTAMAATACARLFRLTGDHAYVEWSMVPLANVLRNCWLWECEYGHAAGYRTFFGLLPMTYGTVITPKEQYEAWLNLIEYLRLAHGAVPAPVEMLVAEFCRHTLNTMRSALAPLMPPQSIALRPQVQRHVEHAAPDLYIPLEDIRDGWRQSGELGQELYGAGMALTFAAHAYTPLQPGLTVYSEYPLVGWDARSFALSGTADCTVGVALLGDVAEVIEGNGRTVPLTSIGDGVTFCAKGGGTYQVSPPNSIVQQEEREAGK
jgi:hypothetical protein